jgi:hypothetical protein
MPDPRPPATATEPPGAPASSARPPDHPPVPRARWSRGAKTLGWFGGLVAIGYAALAFSDYEPGSPDKDQLPASVRASNGGYRSFHFWHSGYHGGK